jgi:hypothetical protein
MHEEGLGGLLYVVRVIINGNKIQYSSITIVV